MLQKILDQHTMTRDEFIEVYKASRKQVATIASLIKEFADQPLVRWKDGPQLALCEYYVNLSQALQLIKRIAETTGDDELVKLSAKQRKLFDIFQTNIATAGDELKLIHRIWVDHHDLN